MQYMMLELRLKQIASNDANRSNEHLPHTIHKICSTNAKINEQIYQSLTAVAGVVVGNTIIDFIGEQTTHTITSKSYHFIRLVNCQNTSIQGLKSFIGKFQQQIEIKALTYYSVCTNYQYTFVPSQSMKQQIFLFQSLDIQIDVLNIQFAMSRLFEVEQDTQTLSFAPLFNLSKLTNSFGGENTQISR